MTNSVTAMTFKQMKLLKLEKDSCHSEAELQHHRRVTGLNLRTKLKTKLQSNCSLFTIPKHEMAVPLCTASIVYITKTDK